MEWSFVRSIVQEAELWMSFVVNCWFILTAAAFLIRRSGSMRRLAEIAYLLSVILFFVTIGVGIGGLFKPSLWVCIPWLAGIGIALSAFSAVTLAIQAGRRFLQSRQI